jgi:hypothetical protein
VTEPHDSPLIGLRAGSHAQLLLAPRKPGLRALRYHLSFLLRERGVDVQHEVLAILPKCCNDEVHSVFHQSADEVHVA